MTDPDARDPYAPPRDPGAPPPPRPWQSEKPRPPTRPPHRDRRDRQDRRDDGRTDSGGRRGFLLAALGVAVTILLFPSPLGPLSGFLLAVAGIVTGIRARRRASGGGTAPGATASIVTGVVAAGLSAVLGLGLLMFLDEVQEYQECMRGANTNVAAQACQQELQNVIEERTGIRP